MGQARGSRIPDLRFLLSSEITKIFWGADEVKHIRFDLFLWACLEYVKLTFRAHWSSYLVLARLVVFLTFYGHFLWINSIIMQNNHL